MSADTFEKVKEIITKKLDIEADKVTLEASFMDDLGADSLDTVELVMDFEEEFGIEISDEQSGKIQTVKDAVEFINANTK